MSKTHRLFIKQGICKGKVRITGDEARHAKVLRLKKGDKVEVFDKQRITGLGTIEKVDKNSVEISILSTSKVRKTGILRALACSAPKNKRFDMLVQKSTELGIDKFIPIITKRSVVKPRETKIERLKKIAVEAAKQSKRKTIPEISSAISVEEIIQNSSEYDAKLIASIKGKRIKEVLKSVKPKKIICLIGPEGGFTDEEINLALENGFKAVNLGDNILRVETAGIAILSAINYEYEL